MKILMSTRELPEITQKLAMSYELNSYGRFEILPREVEVLKWLKEGKSSFEVSVVLNISERTVV
jgi:DNA-binding CsgD family transcriptional regulator